MKGEKTITTKECRKKQEKVRYWTNRFHEFKEIIRIQEEELKKLKESLEKLSIETTYYCPICSHGFDTIGYKKIDNTIPRILVSWVFLSDNKSITYFFKCKRCGTEWH